MNLALRDDLKTLKNNSIYALLGTHLIAFLIIIGEIQGYMSDITSIGAIAVIYMILVAYYYLKIQYIVRKHLEDE